MQSVEKACVIDKVRWEPLQEEGIKRTVQASVPDPSAPDPSCPSEILTTCKQDDDCSRILNSRELFCACCVELGVDTVF